MRCSALVVSALGSRAPNRWDFDRCFFATFAVAARDSYDGRAVGRLAIRVPIGSENVTAHRWYLRAKVRQLTHGLRLSHDLGDADAARGEAVPHGKPDLALGHLTVVCAPSGAGRAALRNAFGFRHGCGGDRRMQRRHIWARGVAARHQGDCAWLKRRGDQRAGVRPRASTGCCPRWAMARARKWRVWPRRVVSCLMVLNCQT